MEKYFRTQEGKLVNIVTHTLEQIEKYPHLRIYVGTDSQVYNPLIRYVTAIVYRYGTRGAHYIFSAEHIVKVKDDYLRLYNEGIRTVEVAQMLTDEIPIAVEAMEFDFANIKKTLSTPLVSAFKGYQNAKFKGGEMLSTKAADHICRHYFEIVSHWDVEDQKEEKSRILKVA